MQTKIAYLRNGKSLYNNAKNEHIKIALKMFLFEQ